jgi:hypothetical protein
MRSPLLQHNRGQALQLSRGGCGVRTAELLGKRAQFRVAHVDYACSDSVLDERSLQQLCRAGPLVRIHGQAAREEAVQVRKVTAVQTEYDGKQAIQARRHPCTYASPLGRMASVVTDEMLVRSSE